MTRTQSNSTERITTFTNDGFVFDVRDSGPIDGIPVVLLHGWPQDSRSWDAVATLLNARGFRTLTPDQRGCSPQARPTRRRDYRLSVVSKDVAALIEQANVGPVHLVGHDWGAAAAWSLAGARPLLLRTLTTVSVPHPVAFVLAMLTSNQALRSWYMFAFQVPFIPERVISRPELLAKGLADSGLNKVAATRDAAAMQDRSRARGGLNWYRGMPFTASLAALRKIRVPTMHIWSDADHAIGPRGAELSPRFVDAPYRFETLHGVGHWIPEEAPEQLDALLASHFE